jgi:hypothetical protein
VNVLGRPQRNHLVWIGALVSTFGLVSYFTLFASYPALRDTAWLNLVLVGIGLTLSILAIGRRRSWLSLGGALLSAACVVLLVGYVFGLSRQLPPTGGVIAVGAVAPDFSLPDQTGATVSLADFAERPVVLVFYRGFW